VLNGLVLEPVPDGCERCVFLSYELPFDGQQGSGWLQDPILIASMERLFTNGLGPHFPPDTILGLQRRTSGYTIGHTAAVLADGTVWAWNAPDGMIGEPIQLSDEALAEIAALEANPDWSAVYETTCAYFPEETVQIGEVRVDVVCPELSLPLSLIPAYSAINTYTIDSLLDERNLPIPAQALPLTARIYYERLDGASVTIFADGYYLIQKGADELADGRIRVEEVDGFANQILATEVVPLGVTLITQGEILNEQDGVELETGEREYEEIILVRSDLGVHEFGWSNGVGQSLVQAITVLDVLLIDEIGLPETGE